MAAKKKVKGGKKPVVAGKTALKGGIFQAESFEKYLYILTAGVFIYFIYLYILKNFPGLLPWPVKNVLFFASDRYGDFFKLAARARENVFMDLSPSWMLVLHYLNQLFPGIDIYASPIGMKVLAWYTAICFILYAIAFNSLLSFYNVNIIKRIWFFAVFSLSYPVLFAIDRGNWAFFTGAIMSLFFAFYIRGRVISAALLLGLAVSFKFYPAVFLVMFLADKKWTGTLVFILAAAACIIFPLSQFQGGLAHNAGIMAGGVAKFQDSAQSGYIDAIIAYNTSVYSFFDAFKCVFQGMFTETLQAFMPLHNIVKYIALAILIIVTAVSFVPKIKPHDRALLLSAGMLLFPLSANDYMIVIVILPCVYWLIKEPAEKIMPWLLGLYFICKRYIAFYNHADYVSVTVQSILNPLLLMAVVCYALWIRRAVFSGFYEEIKVKIVKLI